MTCFEMLYLQTICNESDRFKCEPLQLNIDRVELIFEAILLKL